MLKLKVKRCFYWYLKAKLWAPRLAPLHPARASNLRMPKRGIAIKPGGRGTHDDRISPRVIFCWRVTGCPFGKHGAGKVTSIEVASNPFNVGLGLKALRFSVIEPWHVSCKLRLLLGVLVGSVSNECSSAAYYNHD